MKRAHSWEHIALAPARIVAGDRTLGEEVMRVKSEIFARPRDQAAFKRDAFAMFDRLKSERFTETPTDVWRSKLRRGGLMEADYMRSCLRVAGIPLPSDLAAAIMAWNRLQAWERLLGLKAKPIALTPKRFVDKIEVLALKVHHKDLELKIRGYSADFFADNVTENSYDSKQIIWA